MLKVQTNFEMVKFHKSITQNLQWLWFRFQKETHYNLAPTINAENPSI